MNTITTTTTTTTTTTNRNNNTNDANNNDMYNHNNNLRLISISIVILRLISNMKLQVAKHHVARNINLLTPLDVCVSSLRRGHMLVFHVSFQV